MAAKARGTNIFNATMSEMMTILRDSAFCRRLNFTFESESRTQTGVCYRFLHGTTITSWGEEITITLTPLGENEVQTEIFSKCRFPMQIFDWGKNKKNINVIMQYIAECIYVLDSI